MKGDTCPTSAALHGPPLGSPHDRALGDRPDSESPNLMMNCLLSLQNEKGELRIFGDDYETEDGTGVRDFIHVQDLAEAHVSALEFSQCSGNAGFTALNLGTGEGYTVLQLVSMIENISGQEVKKKIVDRRIGDVAICYADPSKANNLLNWRATRDLRSMCTSAWLAFQRHY